MTLILELPWGPSVNHYYRRVVIRGSARTLISREGREYQKRVAEAVTIQCGGVLYECQLRVKLELYPPNRRAYDVDNRVKPCFDALAHAGVYVNDKQIRAFEVEERELCRPDGKVVATITELQTKSPAD